MESENTLKGMIVNFTEDAKVVYAFAPFAKSLFWRNVCVCFGEQDREQQLNSLEEDPEPYLVTV